MENNYVPYHIHTELSLLDSCTNFKLYVDKAVELKQKAICFSEHGNIYNWIEKKMYCDKKGIKYIHGVEMYLTATFDEKVRDNFHTILIAKNYEGVKEINTIIDLATSESHFYYKPRISFDEFLNISNNVITISACLASPLNRLDENDLYYDKLLKKYDYYEIQYHEAEEQKVYNKRLYELSIKYNKGLISGTDTHAINAYKAECRGILQKAKKIDYTSEDYYDLIYKSYDELVGMFSTQNTLPSEVYLQAINNTNIMSELVEDFKLDLSFKYPKLYDNEEDVFKKRINEKYKYKLKNGIIKEDKRYIENIHEEFRVFKKIGMVGFMLFMSELMTWCRDNDIPFGNCRGSVGGSTIAYILDIIDLDPVVWNTVFSRFANEDRIEVGDIDVDISPDQREFVYKHIIDTFGMEHTAYILAIGTISDKGTIDEIGRALGYELPVVDAIKKEYESNQESTKSKYPEIFYYFDGLINTTISQSMHPAGIVASPITLFDNYGTIWREGKRILCINMEEIHEISLVKYDILGLKNIAVIRDTCKLIGEKYPLSYSVDWDDELVWKDMTESNVGLFQFESSYAGEVIKKYKPRKINDLSLANAALRPSGETYRDRLLNREFNHNPSAEIDELLKDNDGFLVFQEDTLKFLKDICGLSGSEADNIRRAIGRKDEERLKDAMPKILDGYCNVSKQPRDVAEKEAKEFLDIIASSSRYQFGLNHSCGYSMIGYLCAYYRYHHTAEFITSYLNNANNEDDIIDGTKLAGTKGIKILPIKFRYSKAEYSYDKSTNSIYKGIASIKFLNADVSNNLYSMRDNEYTSFLQAIADILATGINTRQLDILIKLDFFSEFGKSQYLLDVLKYYNDLGTSKVIGKGKFPKEIEEIIAKYSRQTEKQFRDLDASAILSEVIAKVENRSISIKEMLEAQKEYLGYISINLDTDSNNCIVLSIDTKYSPKLKLMSLSSGNVIEAKIYKEQLAELEEMDIIRAIDLKKEDGWKLAEDDKWVKNPLVKVWRLKKFMKIAEGQL